MTSSSLECSAPQVEEAFALCADEVRQRARNFWYGLRLLPPDRFRSLCAVYAWMRRADDLADSSDGPDTDAREAALCAYRDRTRVLFDGGVMDDVLGMDLPPEEEHILIAMREVVASFELDFDDFDKMIQGQLDDLVPRSIGTRAELVEYCDRVASTVGRVCVRVWGASDAEALQVATDRGIAFQLTNILRDLREDRDRGRVYLPADELEAAGLDLDQLLAWEDPFACRRFVKEQTAIARELYDRSAGIEMMIDPDCRPTSWAMATIYKSLLEKMAHRPQLIAGPGRIRLSSLRKIAIALRARRRAWHGFGERGGVIE